MQIKNKKMVAVSGGPDSMFLLFTLLKKYNNTDLVVATVNYKTRKNSDKEVEIVRKFCKENQIIFETRVYDVESLEGNFEHWARHKRYWFFKEIYDKYDCDTLFTAHHKDDFIETALIQRKSHRLPLFFGIKKQNYIFEMNVERPFIDQFFKLDILEKVIKNNISYGIDESNFDTTYTRNNIRQALNLLSKKEKNNIYKQFVKLNKKNSKTKRKINKEYWQWRQNNFNQHNFIDFKFKENLIFEFIHSNYSNINLSTQKIKAIIQWYLSKNFTSKYLIKENVYLIKKQGRLLITY